MRDWRTDWEAHRGSDGVRVMHKSRVMRKLAIGRGVCALYCTFVRSSPAAAMLRLMLARMIGLAQLIKGESYEGGTR